MNRGVLHQAASVETACRRLMQLVHPDKLTAHPREAHLAAQIILALRRDVIRQRKTP